MKWVRRAGVILLLIAGALVVARLVLSRRSARVEDAFEFPGEPRETPGEPETTPVADVTDSASGGEPEAADVVLEAVADVLPADSGGDTVEVRTEVEVGIVEVVDDGRPLPTPAELAEVVASAGAGPGLELPAELPITEVLDLSSTAEVAGRDELEPQAPGAGHEVVPPPVPAGGGEPAQADSPVFPDLEAAVPATPTPVSNARAEALLDEGNAYFNVGQYALAVERYDDAVAMEPGLVAALYNRANARTRLGQYDQALADYDAAIALNPRDADALNNRGMLHLHQGSFDSALADLNLALAIDPLDTTVVVNRGLVRLHTGEFTAALDDFTEAARIDPRDAAAHYGAAQACALQGDEPAALNSLRNAFRLDQTYVREAAADPRLASLQSNAEFSRLLRDSGR